MAASLNRVTILGNVGADPEIKSFPNGGRIAGLRIATSRKWRSKATGEEREATEWHRVNVTAEGLVGVVERFVSKGSKLYVEGRLETRKWTDRDGVERYSTEIVVAPYEGSILLCGGNAGAGSATRSGAPAGAAAAAAAAAPGPSVPDLDDEIPF